MKEVIKKLYQIQKEIENLPASASNPFYNSKYVPLNEMIDYIRPKLDKHGLVLIQSGSEVKEGYFTISTMIYDSESGESVGNIVSMPALADAQKMASAMTYGKRTGLSAFFNIVADIDDDGNSLVEPKQSRLDFKDIESKTENMNIEQLNEYSKQLSKQFPGLTDKQKEWLKHHFANRRRSIDQSFNNQNPVDGMFGGDK